MNQRRRTLIALAPLLFAAGLAAPAAAQLLPKLPQLPGVGPLVRDVERSLPVDVRSLTDVRRLHLRELVRRHPRALELDDRQQVVVRGEVLAISPSPQSLDTARKQGFAVVREEVMEEVGLTLVTLITPPGVSARQGVRRLRKADPAGQYDYNHIYTDAGPVGSAMQAAGGASGAGAVRVGLIDTGVHANHPALRGLSIEQHAFAPGGVTPGVHGSATASLMVGRAEGFQGAAPGGSLLVADVYGNGPTGGSASAVVRALAWMAREQAPVVNVSLVGPANATLEAAVKALAAQGTVIVAAVGNDGPAAPPLYPASYPQVVAVTGVDAKGRVLMEAGRGEHVDFAAPGSDMAAAAPDGFAPVRGTSFAAPIVAGKLARLMHGRRSPAAREAAIAALAREARDLGPRGADKTYGRGLVGEEVRVSPKKLRKAG